MTEVRKRNMFRVLMPLALAGALGVGILAGYFMASKSSLSPEQRKLASIIDLIQNEYVDTLDVADLVELAIPNLLSSLDPHSAYISREDFTAVNDDLEGSFSGVGVSFQILNDSVTVVEVIAGGPAEKVGIIAGDRIIKADAEDLTGPDITSDDVFKNLRGKEGTTVTLQVKRYNSAKPLTFEVKRGEIPVNSVTAKYMASPGVGYVKVGKFARNTYDEFLTALSELQNAGAKKFIVDLRDNSGGFMEQAIMMANEFLPKGRMIVYTKARNFSNESIAISDGNGSFQDAELTVLTNEYSASASEIFAGAIQDNDRGLVIGRRTFGKGLVQNQLVLPDSSALRLTVARYYTPSGRSIQKEYERGKDGKYYLDIADRYRHGEFYHADSIKLDKTKKYMTTTGRTVYGGGGVMPDIFVPEDTTGVTSWYVNAVNSGLMQQYAFQVADKYRSLLKGAKTVDRALTIIPRDETLLTGFVSYAAAHGLPARWYYINQSRRLVLRQLKALIIRDAVGYNQFFEYLNREDPMLRRAVGELEKGNSPIVITERKTSKS